jgi:hypothetical protein
MAGYVHRDPTRRPVRELLDVIAQQQAAERAAQEKPPCGSIEAYWRHRDHKEPIDHPCYQANAEYERNRRNRKKRDTPNLRQLLKEQAQIRALTAHQQARHQAERGHAA